jgi:hypothetical protein
MVKTKGQNYRPQFTRNLLHDPDIVRQQLASQLLSAVEELFPDRYQELTKLSGLLPIVYEGEDGYSDDELAAQNGRFWSAVCEWTKKNRLSSEVVNHVAAQTALENPVGSGIVFRFIDEDGKWFTPPVLQVNPYEEGRDDFIRRAGRYYDDLAERCQRGGGLRGPVKRDLEHFKWLAARLVGDFTYARIADGDNGLGLSAASEKTVAGECRKLATLLGIPVPASPDPQRGRSVKKSAHRARR